MNNNIRRVLESDLEQLKLVVESSQLFPVEYLEGMIADYFENTDSSAIWFCKEIDEQLVSFGYCQAEQFTSGTYNLYAIGTLKNHRGQGIGADMLNYIEAELKSLNHRVLIVETSSAPEYQKTRDFYIKNQYNEEARIRDFWQEGEDKIIFWKKL